MPTDFTCQPLAPEEAATVYPLVREVLPGLDLRAWLRFAKRIAHPRRDAREGIIVVTRRTRRMPCGLFIYHRDHDLATGQILVAEHLVAVDVLDPEPVMRALLAELDALAARLECAAIRVVVFGEASQLASGLRKAGHRDEGATMRKDVPGRG